MEKAQADVSVEFENSMIGGLKDLYDAVRLIKEISERYINKKLNDRFGNYFRVDTYSITPREDDFWCFEKRNMLEKGSNWKPQRDAFSIICLWRMWFYC